MEEEVIDLSNVIDKLESMLQSQLITGAKAVSISITFRPTDGEDFTLTGDLTEEVVSHPNFDQPPSADVDPVNVAVGLYMLGSDGKRMLRGTHQLLGFKMSGIAFVPPKNGEALEVTLKGTVDDYGFVPANGEGAS